MKIAVYTIAKNEEQFIERWAKSCEDADYRFILDTGSADKTLERATALGVTVASATINPWRFDIARNTSLSLLPADADICIALDMDEVLLPGWREELEKISENVTRPRYKYTWSWNEDGTPGLEYGGDKIHRRNGYRWHHPVHEVIVADRIEEVQEWTKLEIHHYPDHSKSRGQYFPLLELAVKEDPSNDRNQYYLAREYFFNNMFDKAAEMFKTHLNNPNAQWGPERAASWRYLAKCDAVNAEHYLAQAIQDAPKRREALVEMGMLYYNKQDYEKALMFMEEAILIQEKPLDYLCEDFAWGSLPYDTAAISAFHLNKKDLALRYGGVALSFDPDNERLINNLTYYVS
jgi:tetratricopeptide (TPR) repeat protein